MINFNSVEAGFCQKFNKRIMQYAVIINKKMDESI